MRDPEREEAFVRERTSPEKARTALRNVSAVSFSPPALLLAGMAGMPVTQSSMVLASAAEHTSRDAARVVPGTRITATQRCCND